MIPTSTLYPRAIGLGSGRRSIPLRGSQKDGSNHRFQPLPPSLGEGNPIFSAVSRMLREVFG